MSTVYISFNAEINFQTTQHLLGATLDQVNRGAKHIYYLFSTPGGIVTCGLSIYNTLKGLPVETTMHNVGAVDSIGNAIFLGAKNRYACPHSSFMFHGVGFSTPPGVRFEEKQLVEKLDAIKADHAKIGGIMAKETSLVGKEINRLFLQAQTKDPNFALNKGIVSDIREVSIPQGAQLLQLVF